MKSAMITVDSLGPPCDRHLVIRCDTLDKRLEVLTFLEEIGYTGDNLRGEEYDYFDPNFTDTRYMNPHVWPEDQSLSCCNDFYQSEDADFIDYDDFVALMQEYHVPQDISVEAFNSVLRGG